MPTLKEIAEIRLKELHLGSVEAATQAGIERTYIRDIIEEKKKSVRSDKIEGLARALKLDPIALARGELLRLEDATGDLTPTNAPTSTIPVSGKVAANSWLDVEEMDFDYEHMQQVPSDPSFPAAWQIALSVSGNCLNKIANDGDVLVCLKQDLAGIDYKPEDLVIVERRRYGGQMVERTAKRLRQTADGFELWPESYDPAHQTPLKLDGVTDGDHVEIIAKVTWILKRP